MQRRVVVLGGAALIGAAALAYALDRPPGYGVNLDYRQVLAGPPAANSPAAVAERADFAKSALAIGGPRWQQARRQVFPSGPEVMAEIACAARVQVSASPAATRLLQKAVRDLSRPVEAAKSAFRRDRPYVGAADTRTCDPRTLGSVGGSTGGVLSYAYPSGHAAQGRLVADVLAAALPDRAVALAAWGDRLGDNRVVCRVHWPSDVAAGRRLGDAMYRALQADPVFRADLAAARVELARAPAATNCPAG
jgi:acid phosphatase (class A)